MTLTVVIILSLLQTKHKEKERDKEHDKPAAKVVKPEVAKVEDPEPEKFGKKQLISPDLSALTGQGGPAAKMGGSGTFPSAIGSSSIQQGGSQFGGGSGFVMHNSHGQQTVVVPPLQSSMMTGSTMRSSASRGMARTDVMDLKSMQMPGYPSASKRPPSLTSPSPVPNYMQQGDAIMNRYQQATAPSIASTASAGDVSLALGAEFQQDPSA